MQRTPSNKYMCSSPTEAQYTETSSSGGNPDTGTLNRGLPNYNKDMFKTRP